MAQSETVTLSGLSPSTTYWFDVQVSDSSGASWIYSLASMSVIDEQITGLARCQPCTSADTRRVVHRVIGHHIDGRLCDDLHDRRRRCIFWEPQSKHDVRHRVSRDRRLVSPGSGNWPTELGLPRPAVRPPGWEPRWGTNTRSRPSQRQLSPESQTETVSVTDLAQSTTYWFDLQVTDSSAASWIYSSPTLAVTELPAINNLPPNYNFSPNAGTCTDATATTTLMEDDTYYTTTSTGTGNVLVHLAFNVGTPLTAAGLTSKWQLAYGAVTTAAAAPAVQRGIDRNDSWKPVHHRNPHYCCRQHLAIGRRRHIWASRTALNTGLPFA